MMDLHYCCRHFTVEFLVGERLEHLKRSHLALEADDLIPEDVMQHVYGKEPERQVGHQRSLYMYQLSASKENNGSSGAWGVLSYRPCHHDDLRVLVAQALVARHSVEPGNSAMCRGQRVIDMMPLSQRPTNPFRLFQLLTHIRTEEGGQTRKRISRCHAAANINCYGLYECFICFISIESRASGFAWPCWPFCHSRLVARLTVRR